MRRGPVRRVVIAAVAVLAAGGAGAMPGETGLPSTLRVLVATDEMPEMFSFDPSGPPGFERELVEGFCRLHGLQIELVRVEDFEDMIPMLERGEGDLIVGIIDTATRRRRIAFTHEVFPVRHLAVSRHPAPAVAGPEDLRDRRVGVIPGTSWEEVTVAAGVPPDHRLPFRDTDDLLAGLREKRVDAIVMSLLDYALAKKRDSGLVAGTFVGENSSAAFGVRKQDAQLLESLNAYLDFGRQARHTLMFRYLHEEVLTLIAVARRK